MSLNPRNFEQSIGVLALHPNYSYLLGNEDVAIDLKIAHGNNAHEHGRNVAVKQLGLKSDTYVYPIYRNNHGNVHYSLDKKCRWDSGVCGFMLVSKAQARQIFECKKLTPKYERQILDMVRAEIDALTDFENDDYANDEVDYE